jgi:hypothetical protein
MVNVTIWGEPVRFVRVPAILPEPDTRPVTLAVLSLVQLKVVERRPLLVVRVIVLIVTSEQTV